MLNFMKANFEEKCLERLSAENLFSVWKPVEQCLVMFVHNPLQQKTEHSISAQNFISIVKHSGGGLIIWACLAASGHVHLSVIKLSLNSSTKIFKNQI